MAVKVVIFIADGTEPIEALAPVDILRRGGIDVKLVSAMDETEVALAHDIFVNADLLETEVNFDEIDMIVVPGGSLGVDNLSKSDVLAGALRDFMTSGKKVSSICAGPTILAKLGLLEGRRATCYPGCEDVFPDGVYQNVLGVVVDGNLITASGPGQAINFGIEILRSLSGDEVANNVKSGMLVNY